MSGIINKVKDVLHKDHSSTTGSAVSSSTNHGTHDTNTGNKLDPRIDSDRDGRAAHGTSGLTGNHGSSGLTGTHGTTGNHGSSGLTGTHGTTGTHNTNTFGSNTTTAGPHDSNMANKADPRVDSDLSGSRHQTGAAGYGNHTSSHTTGGTGGLTGSHNTSTNAGPHDSNIANKLDPRVDSDRDGPARHQPTGTNNTTGYSGTHAGNTHGSHTTGFTGGQSHSTNAGPHETNSANKLDPRVDSDLDGRGNRHGASTGGVFGASGSHATAGSGTAQNTAGPHNSDMLNKLDPRVDSDRDASKTFGGNKTHA